MSLKIKEGRDRVLAQRPLKGVGLLLGLFRTTDLNCQSVWWGGARHQVSVCARAGCAGTELQPCHQLWATCLNYGPQPPLENQSKINPYSTYCLRTGLQYYGFITSNCHLQISSCQKKTRSEARSGMVAHTYNHTISEAETGLLQVQVSLGYLHSEANAS